MQNILPDEVQKQYLDITERTPECVKKHHETLNPASIRYTTWALRLLPLWAWAGGRMHVHYFPDDRLPTLAYWGIILACFLFSFVLWERYLVRLWMKPNTDKAEEIEEEMFNERHAWWDAVNGLLERHQKGSLLLTAVDDNDPDGRVYTNGDVTGTLVPFVTNTEEVWLINHQGDLVTIPGDDPETPTSDDLNR